MSRKVTDAEIITALLRCDTQQEAAKELGITPQTVTARMKNPEFVEQYHNQQNEILRAVTRTLAAESKASADFLIRVRDDPGVNTNVRISVARDILKMARDFVSLDEIQRRVSLLEKEFQQSDKEVDCSSDADNLYRTFDPN